METSKPIIRRIETLRNNDALGNAIKKTEPLTAKFEFMNTRHVILNLSPTVSNSYK